MSSVDFVIKLSAYNPPVVGPGRNAMGEVVLRSKVNLARPKRPAGDTDRLNHYFDHGPEIMQLCRPSGVQSFFQTHVNLRAAAGWNYRMERANPKRPGFVSKLETGVNLLDIVSIFGTGAQPLWPGFRLKG